MPDSKRGNKGGCVRGRVGEKPKGGCKVGKRNPNAKEKKVAKGAALSSTGKKMMKQVRKKKAKENVAAMVAQVKRGKSVAKEAAAKAAAKKPNRFPIKKRGGIATTTFNEDGTKSVETKSGKKFRVHSTEAGMKAAAAKKKKKKKEPEEYVRKIKRPGQSDRVFRVRTKAKGIVLQSYRGIRFHDPERKARTARANKDPAFLESNAGKHIVDVEKINVGGKSYYRDDQGQHYDYGDGKQEALRNPKKVSKPKK